MLQLAIITHSRGARHSLNITLSSSPSFVNTSVTISAECTTHVTHTLTNFPLLPRFFTSTASSPTSHSHVLPMMFCEGDARRDGETRATADAKVCASLKRGGRARK